MYIFLSDNRQQLEQFFIQQHFLLTKKILPPEHEHIQRVTNKWWMHV